MPDSGCEQKNTHILWENQSFSVLTSHAEDVDDAGQEVQSAEVLSHYWRSARAGTSLLGQLSTYTSASLQEEMHNPQDMNSALGSSC